MTGGDEHLVGHGEFFQPDTGGLAAVGPGGAGDDDQDHAADDKVHGDRDHTIPPGVFQSAPVRRKLKRRDAGAVRRQDFSGG